MNLESVTRDNIDAFFEDCYDDVVGVDGSENVYEIIARLAREKALLELEVVRLKSEVSRLSDKEREVMA